MYSMQPTNVQFKIMPYGDNDDFMLVRLQEKNYGPGLPPHTSQTILMNKSEIGDLIRCLAEMK